MRFRRALEEEPEVNLIPLIDVMLIVLIFLAVTTTYQRFSELQIELPTADATKTQNRPQEIQIGVTADGRIAIDRVLIGVTDPAAVAEQLQKAAKGRDKLLLVINADAQAPHQAVINVMEAARLANLPRISFATQRQTAGGRR
jgi:biopolymer transport protein ExbD